MVRFETGKQVIEAAERIFAQHNYAILKLTVPPTGITGLSDALQASVLEVNAQRTRSSELVYTLSLRGPIKDRESLEVLFDAIFDARRQLVESRRASRADSVPGAKTPLSEAQAASIMAQVDVLMKAPRG